MHSFPSIPLELPKPLLSGQELLAEGFFELLLGLDELSGLLNRRIPRPQNRRNLLLLWEWGKSQRHMFQLCGIDACEIRGLFGAGEKIGSPDMAADNILQIQREQMLWNRPDYEDVILVHAFRQLFPPYGAAPQFVEVTALGEQNIILS